MKKDSIRDYATAAFQYYAFLGKPQWGDYDKFGKTAFLTREEAEKSLEDK